MKKIYISLFVLLSFKSFGQSNGKIDLTEFIREIQKWQKQENNMSLAFWIPTSYWKVVLDDSPQVSKEALSQIEFAFKDYVVVGALDLDVNANGTMNFTTETELRKSISIQTQNGSIFKPIPESNISDEAKSFSSSLKPLFSQIIGQMGAGLHFYFFSVKDRDGKNILDERKNGKFTIKHSNINFDYSLPLVALLPPKVCPKDGASMKGNWNFCPIHGVRL